MSCATISIEFIEEARREAENARRDLLPVLEEKTGFVPKEFVKLLADTFGYPSLGMEQLHELMPAFEVLPYTEAQRRECVAFRDGAGELRLVFSDPFNVALLAWAEECIRESFGWYLAHQADIAAYLSLHEETMRASDGVLTEGMTPAGAFGAMTDLSLKSISEDTSPVVKLVNSTLYDALKLGASDVHMETGAGGMTIKYRIDGVLTVMGTVNDLGMCEQAISRVKVMAEMDIAEKRVPQDGRFKVSVKGKEVDFRVSIMPSIFGEDAVLRILDKQALADHVKGLRLDYLGFDENSIRTIRRMSNEPYGMLLVTGPTGSGKTTTLYGAITEINRGEDKIITIEDPVEYQLAGVLQIPVNEKKGLTFAKGLRSILRHDPDKIMVGEIRDAETAQIAVQSALTGHLVFTTVHANNVFDVIGRFIHMEVDPYSFVSALNGIVAQRLLRVVCPHCAAETMPDEQLLRESGISPEAAKGFRFVQGRGCGQCRGTGYKGRKAIAEILQLNDEIRELIIARAPVRLIKEAACRNGTRLLREAALELVRAGQTSLQEINRVTFVA
jgi:general secretion pathway protein E